MKISINLYNSSSVPSERWRVALHDIEQPPYYMPRVLNCEVYDSFCRKGRPIYLKDGTLRYKGAPEMIPAYSGNMNGLNKEWQLFCFRLLIWSRYGLFDEFALSPSQKDLMVHDFTYLYGGGLAWCNNTGTDTNHSYITNTNPDREDIKMEALTCGGKLLDVLDTVSHGSKEYLQCKALDILKQPPSLYEINPATHPELFTVSVVSRYDRTVTLFPRSYKMYVPFQDRGGVFEIETGRTRMLKSNEPVPPKVTIP